jgi:hypothetical protein
MREGEVEWAGGGCWAGIEVVGRCEKKKKQGEEEEVGRGGKMGQAGPWGKRKKRKEGEKRGFDLYFFSFSFSTLLKQNFQTFYS